MSRNHLSRVKLAGGCFRACASSARRQPSWMPRPASPSPPTPASPPASIPAPSARRGDRAATDRRPGLPTILASGRANRQAGGPGRDHRRGMAGWRCVPPALRDGAQGRAQGWGLRPGLRRPTLPPARPGRAHRSPTCCGRESGTDPRDAGPGHLLDRGRARGARYMLGPARAQARRDRSENRTITGHRRDRGAGGKLVMLIRGRDRGGRLRTRP
jgi:hypothetical protein